jgi:hypothetical protein
MNKEDVKSALISFLQKDVIEDDLNHYAIRMLNEENGNVFDVHIIISEIFKGNENDN